MVCVHVYGYVYDLHVNVLSLLLSVSHLGHIYLRVYCSICHEQSGNRFFSARGTILVVVVVLLEIVLMFLVSVALSHNVETTLYKWTLYKNATKRSYQPSNCHIQVLYRNWFFCAFRQCKRMTLQKIAVSSIMITWMVWFKPIVFENIVLLVCVM